MSSAISSVILRNAPDDYGPIDIRSTRYFGADQLRDERGDEMESETNPVYGGRPSPTIQTAGEAPTSPQASAPDKTVTTGLERASAYVKEKVADYREGGIEQISEDIVGYTRTEPMTALIIATGVGLVVGMLLILARK